MQLPDLFLEKMFFIPYPVYTTYCNKKTPPFYQVRQNAQNRYNTGGYPAQSDQRSTPNELRTARITVLAPDAHPVDATAEEHNRNDLQIMRGRKLVVAVNELTHELPHEKKEIGHHEQQLEQFSPGTYYVRCWLGQLNDLLHIN